MGVLDDQVDERRAAQPPGHLPGAGLVDPHERRLDGEGRVHAKRQRPGQGLERVVAAVGVARVVGLTHAADQGADAAAVGERGGVGEEQEVAAGHERVRQAGCRHLEGGVAGERRVADLAEGGEVEHVVRPEPRGPPGIVGGEGLAHGAALDQLHGVPLAVAEAHRLDPAVALERRGEADRGCARRRTIQGPPSRSSPRHGSASPDPECGDVAGYDKRPVIWAARPAQSADPIDEARARA